MSRVGFSRLHDSARHDFANESRRFAKAELRALVTRLQLLDPARQLAAEPVSSGAPAQPNGPEVLPIRKGKKS